MSPRPRGHADGPGRRRARPRCRLGCAGGLLLASLTATGAAAGGTGGATAADGLGANRAGPVADDGLRANAERLRRVRVALEQDRLGLADRLYREVLATEPDHEEAYRGLVRLTQERPLPERSARYEASRSLVSAGFREYESRRFVVLSNAEGQWTQAQLGRMERAHHQFQRWARRVGLRPLPLRHKLVCVLFQTREEYAEFARNHDQMHDAWIFGYYSLPHDRTVFYNGEAVDGVDDFTRLRSIATTIHETIHQLLYHTRVQNPYVQYPLWVTEGLATVFETDAPREAFGPEREFEPRRDRFRRLLEADRLLPLRTLVRLDRMPTGDVQRIQDIYNQSYAFVAWLSRHRRSELRHYLMLMLEEPPGRPSPERQLQIFTRAFGEVDRLENRWVREERAEAGRGAALAEATGDAAAVVELGVVGDAAGDDDVASDPLFPNCCSRMIP